MALKALLVGPAVRVPAPREINRLSTFGEWLLERLVHRRMVARFPWLFSTPPLKPRSSAESDRLQVLVGRFELREILRIRAQLLRLGL